MRTRQEIDQEYSQLAMQYGDKTFKHTLLQGEMQAIHQQMVKLSREPARGQALPEAIPPPEDKTINDSISDMQPPGDLL